MTLLLRCAKLVAALGVLLLLTEGTAVAGPAVRVGSKRVVAGGVCPGSATRRGGAGGGGAVPELGGGGGGGVSRGAEGGASPPPPEDRARLAQPVRKTGPADRPLGRARGVTQVTC